jgi:hypothetical protein
LKNDYSSSPENFGDGLSIMELNALGDKYANGNLVKKDLKLAL